MISDRATIDFETRSKVDISTVGAWNYSVHPSTEILCISFRLPHSTRSSLWHAGYPGPNGWADAGMWPGYECILDDLFAYVRTGGLVEAHNSGFEEYMWDNIFSKPSYMDALGLISYRQGANAPSIAPEQWRCSAAKAAAFSLPRALGNACKARFGEELKDEAGHKVMLRLCKPRKVRKGESKWVTYWEDRPDLFATLFEYCLKDTEAEHKLSASLPDLPPSEYIIWRASMDANRRGVKTDRAFCEKALRLKVQAETTLNAELQRITGIERGSERAKVLAWLQGRGIDIADTTKDTVAFHLEQPHVESILRVLQIVRDVNRTSTAKFASMLAAANSDDDRVRDLVMYWGATTGRFTGKGIQVHNYPRGNLKLYGLSMVEAIDFIMASSFEEIESFCESKGGDVLDLLVSCLRGALIPDEGMEFISADYSAIEARFAFWFADVEEALEIFRSGRDIYCEYAAEIFRRPVTKADERERAFGKEEVLSLGFGVGFVTFAFRVRKVAKFTHEEIVDIIGDEYRAHAYKVDKAMFPRLDHFLRKADQGDESAVKKAHMQLRMAKLRARQMEKTCKDNKVTMSEMVPEFILAAYVVSCYRTKNKAIVDVWGAMETAAIAAIKNPGQIFHAGKCDFQVRENTLFVKLPTARELVYNTPGTEFIQTPWGEIKEQVTFWGVAKKGAKIWKKQHTYGSSIFENAVQASARDQMCYAIRRMDGHLILRLVMSIHDEIVSEILKGALSVEEFEEFMAVLMPGLEGLPVKAEGGTMARFKK